jgi:hypothetical protein
MTESEFETQLLTLSTKIGNSLAQPGGDTVKSQLGSLAMTATSTPDLDSAFAALTDPAKFAALEAQVAAQVAAASPAAGGASGAAGSPGAAGGGAAGVAAAPAAGGAAGGAGGGGGGPNGAATGAGAPARGYMWVAPIISFAIIAGFFSMLTVLLVQNQHPPPATTTPSGLQNVLFTLLGALGAAFTQVVNFWLGSSKGSSDKTDILAAQSQQQQ